ncbi:MAG: hypothetical protein LBC07_01700 [Elusimicrobiota bacterium]|nr:hypothetical protein [Elusimicrobiota bacterium]
MNPYDEVEFRLYKLNKEIRKLDSAIFVLEESHFKIEIKDIVEKLGWQKTKRK